jgi:hypothetical protein
LRPDASPLKAGRVPDREELFGIGAGPPAPPKLDGHIEIDGKAIVTRVAASLAPPLDARLCRV